MSKAKSQLQLGNAEEDYQTIGLLCREILISVGQAVFDPDLHPTSDGIVAGKTDAGRMLEAYIGSCLADASNKEVRAQAKASLALALNLQHRTAPHRTAPHRTAPQKLASLCLEAIASTFAVISIIDDGGDHRLQ
ncbi:MAG: hypothetical protein RL339_2267 [Pseudomonadota bacterium]|jgi:hypothetical protein